MTDVQVSNARRIGFTALAVVAFWVLSFRGYSAGCEVHPISGSYVWRHGVVFENFHGTDLMYPFLFGLLLAPIPTAFLHLSCSSRLLTIPGRSVWLAGLVLVCACGFCFWLGALDSETALYIYSEDKPLPTTMPGFTARLVAARQAHTVSWLSLLAPIILTTAFVIFGAWRRAVRDAMLELVDEDD